MLTVDDFAQIRRAHRDGMTIRQIARTFHHSRRKVREALSRPEPQPFTRKAEPVCPVLGPFKAIIDAILAADESAPPKQRHSATQVFRRLVAEHAYKGGYDQVRRYIQTKRRRERPTFVPLSHDPGRRLECDFGHIQVDFPEGRREVPVLVAAWSYSSCPFVIALPTERTEAVLDGMVRAFEFFGRIPGEVWWDNPKTVAAELLKGRDRRINERYAALASHYAFEPLFCMAATPTEKPDAENLVKIVQRRFATPVPAAADFAELNAYFRRCCLEYREHVPAGWSESIGKRFEADRAAAAPLPQRAFDPCTIHPAVADKHQTVQYDNNRYSVPRAVAFRAAAVKAYVDRIEVVCDGRTVAMHTRTYERGRQVLDPLHYLAAFARRPGALDHSAVGRDWVLPPVFTELRAFLEARKGPAAGVREFTRILQLLGEHPIERIAEAIAACRCGDLFCTELIAGHAARLCVGDGRTAVGPAVSEPTPKPPVVQVPMPDLRRFDRLLMGGN
jgi:transposase